MCPTDFVFNCSQTELRFHFSKPIFHSTVLKWWQGQKMWLSDKNLSDCQWDHSMHINQQQSIVPELSQPSNKNLYKVLEGEQQSLTKLRVLPTHASEKRFEGFFPLNNNTEDKSTEQKFSNPVFDLGFVTCNYNHY